MNHSLSTAPKPETIAIFGGAFDPFHLGHAAVIEHLLGTPGISRVIVMPSGDRPDKRELSPAQHRLELATLGVNECFPANPRVVVSDLHASGKVGYGTVDLVLHYQNDPTVRAVFVIGQELICNVRQWKDADSLRQKAEFLVLHRPGAAPAQMLEGWKMTFAEPFPNGGVLISSTAVREQLARGEDASEFIPQSVIDYCLEKKLYT
jgi:nicotinate-nucleotide adenylyltransferase